MPNLQTKVNQDSDMDFRINPDVCCMAPKMYRIYFLVGISHFAKYCKNRSVAVHVKEMLINLLKSPIPQ